MNDNNAYPDIAKYFEAVSEELNGQSRQASLLENASVVGGDREEVYRRFLERHLPKHCEVHRGGYVFNLKGERSNQIDVIMTWTGSPRFEMGSGSLAIAPIEGTVAVAEIKTNLDERELKRSLDAIRKLPLIDREKSPLAPIIRTPKKSKWQLPYKILFAYDGIDKDRLYSHLVQYYKDNRGVPKRCRPDLVHVLGKYAVLRVVPGLVVPEANGVAAAKPPDSGEYRSFSEKSDLFAIMFMLTTIQRNLFLAQYRMTDYLQYTNMIAEWNLRQT